MTKKENATEIFGKGYSAGYNQCKVDRREITQNEADGMLSNKNGGGG